MITLNKANDEIRLVTLYPDNNGTLLQIEINISRLPQASNPPYDEALS